MRYLALDIGTRTIGLAISDKTNTIASPLKTISFTDMGKAMDEVIDIINSNKITHIAIGNPLNMDGSSGFASERSKNFKKELLKKIDVDISFVDERLTTKEAESILINSDYRREKRKHIIDGVAAVLILETFMKMKGEE